MAGSPAGAGPGAEPPCSAWPAHVSGLPPCTVRLGSMATAGTATASCPIPGGRDLPAPDGYGSTPGGTLYSTTPGGTRIIYDRKFLLECKNSPVARTPPCCLPQIPGVTSPAQPSLVKLGELKEQNESEETMPDQDQFEMDI